MVCDDVAVHGPHGDARIASVNVPDVDGDVVRIVRDFTGTTLTTTPSSKP